MKKIIVFALMALLVLGLSTALVSAGDYTITVHKFNDLDGDGFRDDGEPGIPDWEIRLYKVVDDTLVLWGGSPTDSAGTVTFTGLLSGYNYGVWEAGDECWRPTAPPGLEAWEGGYLTVADLTMPPYAAVVEFGNEYTCVPPPPQLGTGTPGYWKNHPDAWPVEEITIGGMTYSKDEAIEIMNRPEKGDKTYTLFRALVAAKLNVLIGNDSSCIAGTIAAADAWMAEYGPVGSGVKAGGKKSPWREGEPLYETLDDYNNGELCAPSRDDLE